MPQAQEQLRGKGFQTFESKNVPCGVTPTDGNPQCSQDDINKVIQVNPAIGTEVATSTKIVLTVGVSPGKASVPDLKGK